LKFAGARATKLPSTIAGTCETIRREVDSMVKRNEAPNYNDEICDIDHSGEVPQSLIESLPFREAHPFRHRCAACAFVEGLSANGIEIAKLGQQVKELTEENERLRAELASRT